MCRIKEFYYSLVEEAEVCTANASSGKLHLKNYLARQPKCFRGIAKQAIEKPRKLVLSDYTAWNWSDYKRTTVKDCLKKLMRQGFEIFLWQNGKVLPLNEANLLILDDPETRKSIEPEKPEIVIDAAIQQHKKITHDNVFLLDDYWLDRAIVNTPAPPQNRPLDFDVFCGSNDKQKRKIISLYQSKKTKPKLQYFISEYGIVDLNDLSSLFKITPLLTGIFFSNPHKISNGETWDVNRFLELLLNAELPVLKHLKLINASMRAQHLVSILEKFPRLETLNLSNTQDKNSPRCNSVSRSFCVIPVYPSLRTLHLSHTEMDNFDATDLKDILEKFPNLEELNLDGMPAHIWSKLSSCPNLLNLKRLRLNSCGLTADTFAQLLTKIPDIEAIDVSNINRSGENSNKNKIHDAFFQLPADFQLRHLEKINLENTNVDPRDVNDLLKRTPNLVELSVEKCAELVCIYSEPDDISVIFSETQHVHLKTLKTSLRLSSNELRVLSEQAPNVESLYCGFLEAWREKYKDFNFSKLKKLHCTNFCQAAQLRYFLRTSPLLEEFSICCQQLRCFSNITISTDQKFPNIKKIILRDKQYDLFRPEDIHNFLAVFPNLDDETRSLLQAIKEEKPTEIFTNPSLSPAPPPARENKVPMHAVSATRQSTIPTPQLPNTKRTVDADTHWNKDTRYKLAKIFYPVNTPKHPHDVSDYRFQVFDKLSLSEKPVGPESAFELSHTSEDLQLRACSAQRLYENEVLKKAKELKSEDSIYYASPQKYILDKNWQPIASLSPEETMLFYHTEPAYANIQIQYSERDNLHYIRSTDLDTPKIIHLDWAVQIPDIIPLPPHIQKRVDAFNKEYKAEDLQKTANKLRTGKEYLNAITTEKKGSCRHRSIAFMEEMQHQHPTRIPINHCHMFAELRYQGRWLRCDLGGYEAHIDVMEPKLEEKKPITEKKLSSDTPASPTPIPAPTATLEALANASPPTNPAQSSIHFFKPQASALPSRLLPNPYLETMKPWEDNKKVYAQQSIPDYCEELINPANPAKKILIELNSQEAVDAMVVELQKTCYRKARPVFYIHAAEDLVCLNDCIQRENNKGIVKEGPAGPLFDFLTADYTEDNPPIIIFNAANFNLGEIVSLNTVFGLGGRIDSIDIPQNALLIQVSNTESEFAYQVEDNSSRIDSKETPGAFLQRFPDFLPKLDIQEAKMDDMKEEDVSIIHLYHSSDWKSLLLGRWDMTSEGLCYEEGALKHALTAKKPIVIQNGLWEDKEFLFFWQQAFRLGHIMIDKQAYSMDGITILKGEGYRWEQDLKPYVQLLDLDMEDNPKLELNPGKLPAFLGAYEYQEDKETLLLGKGIIHNLREAVDEENRDREIPLKVYLTRELSDDHWAALLQRCHDKNIKLLVKLAPGVCLPEQLSHAEIEAESKPRPLPTLPLWKYEEKPADTCIIESSDPDTTIAMLKQDPNRRWYSIDVSECQSSDLLLATTPKTAAEDRKNFKFSRQINALLTELENNENIILTGKFSDDLVDALVPLLRERQTASEQKKSNKGRLAIVTENIDKLRYSSKLTMQHPVKPEEKLPFLKTKHTKPLDESLCILQGREQYPDGYLKLQRLEFDRYLGSRDLSHSEKDSEAFHKERNRLIDNALFHPENPSPCVYICGLSGVGKTTFIEKELLKGLPHKVLYGENDIEAWALEEGKVPTYLFIDEANLSSKQWTEMEGLFNKPPTILINGILRRVTPNHKIIFAGNPLNDSDERKLPDFFKRHPCVVEFTPLSYPVVFEDIIKPVFAGTELKEEAVAAMSQHFLNIYEFLSKLPTPEILISPRELQMMALLTLSYCIEMKAANPDYQFNVLEVARHYAYKLGKALIPTENLSQFENAFGAEMPPLLTLPLPLEKINAKADIFRATASRMPALRHIHELLRLRDIRVNQFVHMAHNDAQLRGGLGGVILEGGSSVGKTSMVYAVLEAYGFEEEKDYNHASLKAKPYYRIDPGTSTKKKQEIIVQAVYEGVPLVMDEFNCANTPSLERLLNDVLMGKLPKEFQVPGKTIKPGCVLFLMQNSKKMPGRRAETPAQSRRVSRLEIPPYTAEELLEIIMGDCVYPDAMVKEFKLMIEAFIQRSKEAEEQHYSPKPTLRKDLLDKVKKVKQGYAVQEEAVLERKHSFSESKKTKEEATFIGRVDNCSTTPSTPTCRGLTAASIDPAVKPRGVGAGGNCQHALDSANPIASLDILRQAFREKRYEHILQSFQDPALIKLALQEKLIDATWFKQEYRGEQHTLIQEIAAIGLFYQQQSKHKKYQYSKEPLLEFCSKAIQICQQNPRDKQNQLNKLAKTSFKHRHLAPRLIADFFLLLSCSFGLGFLIGYDRQTQSKTFLLSREQTARQKAFHENLLGVM